jgi:hypothetical protein
VDVLLTLILSCSVHLDDSLVEALSYKLSVGNQFFVGDLTTLKTSDSAKSLEEARRIVSVVEAAGGRPAVGFMAVPLEWAARFGREPDDLFDGCTNIAIGTSMLSDFARLCSAGPRRHRRMPAGRVPRPTTALRTCILRRLETEMNVQGIVENVMPVIARIDLAPPDNNTDPPPARAPVFLDSSDTSQDGRDWSSPRLFLSPPTALPEPTRAGRPAPGPSPIDRQSPASRALDGATRSLAIGRRAGPSSARPAPTR